MELAQVGADVLHLGTGFGFEAHRNAGEARIVDEAAERIEAEVALADMLMAIDARMERLERIVDVEGDEAIEPHMFIELGEGAVVALFRAQIVARSEGVLGIEAQAQALVSQKAARSYTTAKQDIQESSLRHLQDAAEMYDLLAKRTHWATIECVDRTTNEMRTPQSISADLLDIVESTLSGESASGTRSATAVAKEAR